MRNKVCFYMMLVLCIGLCMSVVGCKSSKKGSAGAAAKYDGEMLYNGFDSTKDMYRVSQLFEWNYSPMAKLEVVGKDNFLPIVVEDEETIAEQAAQVMKLIEELPSAEDVKASDKAAVAEARSAYGALAKSGKLAVTNLDKLKEVEASPALAGLYTIGDLGEDFSSDISNSGSWLGYSATLADPMEGTVVLKASGIAANQDGAFYISMFHDGSKDYGQSSDGIAFWVRTMNNTILPENSTNEPIAFKPGKSVSADKVYTFYVTYKVAEDYSKLSVTIRMEDENGSVIAEGTTDVTNFKLTNFGEQTVKSWLGNEGAAKAHQTFYVNPGNSSGVNIMSAWAATQESDYKEAVEVTDICSEEDLAPQQGDGALRVSYERGSFTEILARFDNSLIPDMPVDKLCEVSVKIFNYSEEEKKVSLSLMKEQNLAVALDNNEFTLAPYAWTECRLSMDSVVVEYLAEDLIGLNIRFKDVVDAIYYIDDFRVTFESEYGENSLALIEKVEALRTELQTLKDKKVTLEDKELLVSLYSRYLELPIAYQYMVDNFDLLKDAIQSYYAIITKENLANGSDVLLHANEILGVSQFGEYAGGTVSFTTEDTVDGDGCVSLDFDGTIDYINIPITPTTTNAFSEVHLWVNNPTDNKYAVYLNWKLSDAAVGEAITEDNAVGGYLIPANSGWVELIYRSEFAVAEINVAMLDKRNTATPATDHILIGKIVGYVNPVRTVSPRVTNVEKLISALPAYKSGYSQANREAVAKARAAYYALTELQQSQVSNISRLIGIEASIWREGFAGLPKVDAITKYDRNIEIKFETLRSAYEALDPAVQKAVQKDMALLEQLEDKMATYGKNALHFNESIEQAGIFEGGNAAYVTDVHFADEKGSMKLTFDGSKDWITVPVTPSKVVPFDELHIWVNNTSNHKLAFYPNWNTSDEASGDKFVNDNLEGGFVLPANSGWIEITYKTQFALSELNIVALDASGNPAKSTTGTLHVGKANYVYNIYEVIDMIDALDGKNMEAIWAARAAYEALIPESQKKVTNIDKLRKFEQALIDEVEDLIAALPEYSNAYTSADKQAVREARAAYDNLRPEDQKKVSNILKLINIEKKLAAFGETILHFDQSIEQAGLFTGGKGSYTTSEHVIDEKGSLKLTFNGSTTWVTIPVTPSKNAAYDELHIWVNNTSDQRMAFQLNWKTADEAIGSCVIGDNLDGGYVLPAKSGWVQLIYRTQFELTEMNITALDAEGNAVTTTGTFHVGRAEYVYLVSRVNAMIDALDGTDAEAVKAARKAYNALPDSSKQKITNIDKLIGYEVQLFKAGFAGVPQDVSAIKKYDAKLDVKLAKLRAEYDALDPKAQESVQVELELLTKLQNKLATFRINVLHFNESIEQAGAFAGGKGTYTTAEHFEDENGSLKLEFDGTADWMYVPVTPSSNASYDELHIWVNNTSDKRIAFYLGNEWKTADAAIGDSVTGGNVDNGFILPANSGWIELIYRSQFSLTQLVVGVLDDSGDVTKTTGTLHIGKADYVYLAAEVQEMINALDGTDAEAVKAAREAYNALPESSKNEIQNIDKLIGYEVELFKARCEGLPQDASAIKTYDAELDTRVAEILTEYEALAPEVQQLVQVEKELLTQIKIKLESLNTNNTDSNIYTLTDLTSNAGYTNSLAQSSVAIGSWDFAAANLPNAMEGTIKFNATGIAAGVDGAMYITLFHDGSVNAGQAGDGIMTFVNSSSLYMAGANVPFESGKTITAGQTYKFTVAYKVAEDYSKLTFSVRIETADGTLIVDSGELEVTNFTLNDFGSQTVKSWLKDHANAANHQTLYINGGNSTQLTVTECDTSETTEQNYTLTDMTQNAGYTNSLAQSSVAIGSWDFAAANLPNAKEGTIVFNASGIAAGVDGAMYITLFHDGSVNAGQAGDGIMTFVNSSSLYMAGANVPFESGKTITAGQTYKFTVAYKVADDYSKLTFSVRIETADGTLIVDSGEQEVTNFTLNDFGSQTVKSWLKDHANAANHQTLYINGGNSTQLTVTECDTTETTEQNYTLTDMTQNTGYTNSLAQSSVAIGSWDFAAANLPNAKEGTIVFNATGIAAGVDGAMYITLFHDGSANAGQAADGIMTYVNSSSMYVAGANVSFESGKTITAGQTYRFTIAYKVADDYSKLTFSVRMELADGTLICDSGDQELTSFSLPGFGSQTVESWMKNHTNAANHQTLYINGGNSTQLTVSAVE